MEAPARDAPGDPRAPLLVVLRDLGLAMALALALSVVPTATALLGAWGGLPVQWTLGPPSLGWEIATPPAEEERLLADARALAGPDDFLALEPEEGSRWLTLVESPGTDASGPVGGLLRDRGAWTGRLRTESGFARILRRSLGQPGEAAAVFPFLVPWLFLASGAAFLLVGLRGRRRRPEPRWEPAGGGGARRVLLGIGLGAGLVLAVEGLTRVLGALGLSAAEQGMVTAVAKAGGPTFALFAATAVLLAPVAEEVLFRGHLFRILRPRSPAWLAHGVTAVLFAAVHFHPAAIPAYVLYSVGLSLAYERTRSLLVPVVAHAVVNAVGVAFLAAG